MMYFVLSIFQFFLLFVQRNWDGWERWSVKSCVKQPLPAWQRTPYLWQEVSWHTESAQDSRCQQGNYWKTKKRYEEANSKNIK